MRDFLSRRRYLVVGLCVSSLCAAVHLWVERKPSTGLSVAGDAQGTSLGAALAQGLKVAEGSATDVQFRLRGPRAPHPDVAVVAIDERSAQRYGLWPWPRDVLAQLIGRLIDGGASAVGLDITFTDATADARSGAGALLAQLDAAIAAGTDPEHLQPLRERLVADSAHAPDAALAAALTRAGPTVIQGVFPYPEADAHELSPQALAEQDRVLGRALITRVPLGTSGAYQELDVERAALLRFSSALVPLPQFAEAGSRLAHVQAVADLDGTLRRAATLVKLTRQRGLLPALAVETAAQHLRARVEPWLAEGELLGVRLRGAGGALTEIAFASNEPFTEIDYVGPGSVFPALSAIDVIDGRVPASAIAGKALLVGVTLTGSTGDQRVTPFRALEPGLFTHASLLSGILSHRHLSRPFGLVLLEALLMLALSLLLARVLPRLPFGAKALLIVALLVGWLAADQLLFSRGIALATVLPVLNLLGTAFALIFLGYLSVDREKLKMRSTFSRYLGEDVMEEALRNPEKLTLGEKREMTVMFSDIRGFTTLSERMAPEKLASFINGYLSPMTQIVFDEKGTLDKYIGDAVMAFWNAPLDQPDHALRACRAALAMLAALEALKGRWRAEGLPEFDIGIGLNSGPMVVGNMGSDVRVDYTVLGDAVNLASRLEGTNKEYETRVIIGEGTYALVQGSVSCRRLGAVRVKGKQQPVRIYELRGVGTPSASDAEGITAFEAALDAYGARRWEAAEAGFGQVLARWPGDGPSRRYLERIAALREAPPGEGWDGVDTATTK